MNVNEIMMPTKIRFGPGSIENIGEDACNLGAKRVLVVTDPGVYKSGVVEPVKTNLGKAGLSVDVFSEAEPEPSYAKLNLEATELRKNDYDLMVGVGGGSSIDTAKGLSVLFTHGGIGEDYGGIGKIPGPCVPVFACPTTAGTGAEVTRNAIFDDTEQGKKIAMVSPYLIPKLALVDPTLTYGCPPKVTAASGIDALVHAIESYTGTKAHEFSDALATQAMRLIAGNLRAVVKDGSEKEARNRMAEGSLLAGMALASSGVAAVHALAYILGSRYHVSHGIANGLLLPYVTERNLSANLTKYAVIALMLGGENQRQSLQATAEQGVLALKQLVTDIGLPLRLRELGVAKESLEEMALATMDVTRLLANNPKPLTLNDVKDIWQNAW